MNEYIYSLLQDYETHLFTCENCKTQTLGEALLHDFEASELVMPLDCPGCNGRVALLNIQASKSEIRAFAAQGFKTAQEHLSSNIRWYESFPDFSQGLNAEEAAERAAYAIEFMADAEFGEPAIQLMDMLLFGIKLTSREAPYICDFGNPLHSAEYFQVNRGCEEKYLVEISSEENIGKQDSPAKMRILKSLGWSSPSEESPNFQREFNAATSPQFIAALSARRLMLCAEIPTWRTKI